MLCLVTSFTAKKRNGITVMGLVVVLFLITVFSVFVNYEDEGVNIDFCTLI